MALDAARPRPVGGGGVGDAQQVAGDVADAGVPVVLEPRLGVVRGTALGDPGVGAGHRFGLQLRHDVVGLLVSDPDGGQGLEDREPRVGGFVLVVADAGRASSWPYASAPGYSGLTRCLPCLAGCGRRPSPDRVRVTDNRLSNGVTANDTITSHQWVTSSECATFPT